MIEPSDLERKTRALEALFADRLGLATGPLEQRNLRARRMLPRKVRADVATVIRAQSLVGHPKLARQVDSRPVEDAFARAVAHLKGVSRADRIWGQVLSVSASIAFGLIVAFALYLGLLVWRGFL